jgi:hypothetical protein
MKPLIGLYVSDKRYYLCSVGKYSGLIYFREGSGKELFDSSPTFYSLPHDAIDAGTLAGFNVLFYSIPCGLNEKRF